MKRIVLTICISLLAITACVKDDYDYKGEIEAIKAQLASQKALIDVLQKSVTVTDIQKGKDSFTITFSNGDSYTITNGYTPLVEIGENGNWFINGVDTGKPSKGEDGRDGYTCKVEIGTDGFWYIDGVNTGVNAVAMDGIDGKDAPYITSIVEYYTYFTFIFSDGSSINVPKEAYAYVSSERIRTSLESSAIVQLGRNGIRANTLITAAISFDEEFVAVQLGRGYREDGGWMLEIGEKELRISKYDKFYSSVETFTHGLTFSGSLYVSIENGWDGSIISLYSNGEEFRTGSSWSAAGAPFVYNNGGSLVDVDLTFFPYDVQSPVWVMGDGSSEDWTRKLHSDGASPLVDWMPGATAAKMLVCLKNDLNFGNPSFVLWALGSDNKSDVGQVDAAWLTATESFIEICKSRGITPVLATIPSTGAKDHSFKSAWVRESGCRYVDFEATSQDAGAMAYRVLVDLPEVKNN